MNAKNGDLVRYHPIIGREDDGKTYRVRATAEGPPYSQPVAWLEGKAGCVAQRALSLASTYEPQYYDVDGKPCTLDALCIREPAWAASRHRLMLAKIRELEGKLEAAEKALSEKRGFGDPVSFMEHHELQSCLEGYERQLALIAVTHPHLVPGFVVERQK